MNHKTHNTYITSNTSNINIINNSNKPHDSYYAYSPKESSSELPEWVPLVWLALFTLSYSPKVSSLELPEWVSLVWVALFTLAYQFEIWLPPYNPFEIDQFIRWVGGWVGGRIYLSKYLVVKKLKFFLFFFLNVFSYQGERF